MDLQPYPKLPELMANGGHLLVTMALREMTYPEYLGTNHWQTVRRAALKRANYRCQICLSPKLLEVHHVNYDNRGDENAEDVVALCGGDDGCHNKQHKILALIARAEGESRFRE